MSGPSPPSSNSTLPSASDSPVPGAASSTALAVKRNAQGDPAGGSLPAQKKRLTIWTQEEQDKLVELRGQGLKYEDISKRLPGRSAISCRLRYQHLSGRKTAAESQGQTGGAARPRVGLGWRGSREGRSLPCIVCGFSVSSNSILRDHLRRHTLQQTVFGCRHCHSQFDSIGSLAVHVASSHVATFDSACPICGKACATTADLQRHFALNQCIIGLQFICDQDRSLQTSNTVVLNSIEGTTDTNPTENNPESTNRSQRHPPEAIEVLQKWLDSHSIKRYLTAEEKQRLATDSGLTVTQVSTWFSNARSRHRSPLDDWIASAPEGKIAMESSIANEWNNLVSSSTSLPLPSYCGSDYGMVELPLTPRSRAGSACSAFSQCGDAIRSGPPRRGRRKYSAPAPASPFGTQSQSPVLSTFLPASPAAQHSGLFSPASTGFSHWTNPFTSPIVNTFPTAPPGQWVERLECPVTLDGLTLPPPVKPPTYEPFEEWPALWLQPLQPSFQSGKTECTQAGSATLQDDQQLGPTDQPFAPEQRRGSSNGHLDLPDSSHEVVQQDVSVVQDSAPQIAAFQCTFCLKHLSPKSWKRHEETMHLPQFQWICQPQGVPAVSGSSRRDISSIVTLSHCVFCNAWQPGAAHFETCHRAKECADKPRSERAFARKDHLIQHWKNFHGRRLDPKMAESWKVPINYSGHRWSCGFCGVQLADWEARAIHIPKHFREGLTMDCWDSEKGRLDGEEALFKQFIDEIAASASL